MREPLVRTQVVPYLVELARGGHRMHLLTFEPELKARWTQEEIAAARDELAGKGVDWHCLAYHKRPSVPATLFDIAAGARFVRRFVDEHDIDILHARVHVPAAMAALARRRTRRRPKILFDIRGFFPEEYTDAGRWKQDGVVYRAVKRVERWLMREADGFVVLTEKAREILFPESRTTGRDAAGRPVEVIPCCVDLKERFDFDQDEARREMRRELGVEKRKVIVYAGSFGGWYMTDEMLGLFTAARAADPNVFALVLTQRDADKIRVQLAERGFGTGDMLVKGVPADELPRYLAAADVSISFIKNCYSKQSSSPTKLAEYLACGLPIIANRGVGDVDALIADNAVGVLIDEFTDAEYTRALADAAALDDAANRCRDTAKREFDLETVGGTRYRRVYDRMNVNGIR